MSVETALLPPELEKLAKDFLWNAEKSLPEASPFYARLARRIATDTELLALAAYAQPRQPAMNLLFGAVHYLLLRGLDDPLALFYADLVRKPNTQDDPYPIFRAFCLERADEIRELVSTRRVQTNEIARCALFLPAFELVSRRAGRVPLTLLEVGSSAGLNLNWDRYAYAYGDGVLRGDPLSPVVLQCQVRGSQPPPLPRVLPPVAARTGIDIRPNDVFDDDAMLWLRALVWPEQRERAEHLMLALTLAWQYPPAILAGDALELLPGILRELPSQAPIVLFHSFVLNQIPPAARTRYYDLLEEASEDKTVYDIAVEPSAFPPPMILTTFQYGERMQETLAVCDQHGHWLEWTAGE